MTYADVQKKYLRQAFDQLGNKYQINQEIARSQASSLYQAVEIESGEVVALKVFRRKFSADPRFALKFRDLLRKIFNIENDFLVPVLDYGFLDGYYYIASEWVDGKDLAYFLSEAGSLGEVQALAIGSQVCQALDLIHRHDLLHLNLKPENILLSSDGRIKLNDIGLSGLISESGLSRTHVMLGRFHYIAPEQINGLEPTSASDFYSLGIVLYEMLTGRFPFDSQDVWNVLRMHIESDPPPLKRHLSTVSAPVANLVKRALQKEPSMRFSSADEMNTALTSAIVTGVPSSNIDDLSATRGVLESLAYSIRRAIVFIRKPVPLRVFGRHYSFAFVLVGQFLLSFAIIFLFLTAVITLGSRIWNNQDLIRNYSFPAFSSQQAQKSAPKTNFIKPDQSSLEDSIAPVGFPARNGDIRNKSSNDKIEGLQATLHQSIFNQTRLTVNPGKKVFVSSENSSQTCQKMQTYGIPAS